MVAFLVVLFVLVVAVRYLYEKERSKYWKDK